MTPEHTQQDERDHPLYCRSCGGYLGQYEEQTPETVGWYLGWPFCVEHAEEMRQLAKVPDAIETVRR